MGGSISTPLGIRVSWGYPGLGLTDFPSLQKNFKKIFYRESLVAVLLCLSAVLVT